MNQLRGAGTRAAAAGGRFNPGGHNRMSLRTVTPRHFRRLSRFLVQPVVPDAAYPVSRGRTPSLIAAFSGSPLGGAGPRDGSDVCRCGSWAPRRRERLETAHIGKMLRSRRVDLGTDSAAPRRKLLVHPAEPIHPVELNQMRPA